MKIQKISVRNFYSFKEFELDFANLQGVLRILGENKDTGGSNGSGKSAILEAITWGLFGRTIRKSTEKALVNSQEGKDLFVGLKIEKEGVGTLEIERTKRHTSLNLTINGENLNKENAAETQKLIEEILETDYKSYLASVVFGQHSDFAFLDSTPEDKRKIIRNCFNLDDMFGKRMAVKSLKSSYTAELKAIQLFQDKLTSERDSLEKQVPDQDYKFVELPELETILTAEKEILTLTKNCGEIYTRLKKTKVSLKKLKDAEKLGVYTEKKECPVCKGTYKKCQDHTEVERITKEIRDLERNIDMDTSLIENNDDKILKLKPQYTSSEWAEWNNTNRLIENSQVIVDRLKTVNDQIADYDAKINELTTLVEVMKFWELAFSEKGLIKYIIRNILDYFNLKSKEFISILTKNQISIEFTDELVETITNNGVVTEYISLSGGEKRKVNMAIMLALQDLGAKISRTNCNVIFFDEVCDNIDDSGIEAVNNLLGALKAQYPEKVLMLITHNTLLQDLLSESQYITVTKKKGISRLRDDN